MTGPTVKTLLRRDWPHRSPSGGMLTARRFGRRIVLLDIDRYAGPFPDEAGAVMRPIAEDLALIAYGLRGGVVFVSQFGITGTLHAPVGAADALLAVLVAADAGDVTAAHSVAPVIRRHADPLRAQRLTKAAMRTLAVDAIAGIEADLGQAKAAA